MSYWFKHDADAHSDHKLLRLKARCGFEGIGMYWTLMELLHQNDGYLPEEVAESIIGLANAKQMLSTLLELELLYLANGVFHSKRLLAEISNRSKVSKQRKTAGRKGGIQKAKNYPSKPLANAKQNPSREEKRREEKNIYTKTPYEKTKEFFESEDVRKEYVDLVIENQPHLSRQGFEGEVDKFFMYWTELNKSGTKRRWELEKTFEVNRRLSTWMNNKQLFSSRK